MNESNDETKKTFLTLGEASSFLGLKKSTLYAYTHKRVLPFYKLRNARIYFILEDLENFVINETNYHKSQQELEAEVLSNLLVEK